MTTTKSGAGLGAPTVDFGVYPTPPSITRRLIEACPEVRWAGDRGPVWECCADVGAMVRVMREAWPRSTIFASDIRDGLDAKLREAGASSAWAADALDGFDQGLTPFDGLTMTNPDYSIFDALLGMHRARYPLATLALLGRAGMFAGAQERAAMLAEVGHPDTYNVPERPCFVRVRYEDEHGIKLDKVGTTDSNGAAWYVWPPGMPRDHGLTRMLRPETADEKKYKEPIRVLTIARAAWDAPGKDGRKKAPILREEWR